MKTVGRWFNESEVVKKNSESQEKSDRVSNKTLETRCALKSTSVSPVCACCVSNKNLNSSMLQLGHNKLMIEKKKPWCPPESVRNQSTPWSGTELLGFTTTPSGQDHHISGMRHNPRQKSPISSRTVKTHPPDMCKWEIEGKSMGRYAFPAREPLCSSVLFVLTFIKLSFPGGGPARNLQASERFTTSGRAVFADRCLSSPNSNRQTRPL